MDSPSFKGFRPESELSSRVKRKSRSRDTQHELMLRREICRMGLHYRKNVASMPGKPDLGFAGARVVVYCDGDFWQGRNWEPLAPSYVPANPDYWVAKIRANIERNARNVALLEETGWNVIRLRETDIRRDPSRAVRVVWDVRRAGPPPC